jgi:hypothetical protein
MMGVGRIVLPVALASLAIWSYPSGSKSEKNVTLDRVTFAAAAETTNQKPKPSTPAVASVEPEIPPEKSPSVIQMLEGREEDLIIWASIAVVFFAIGWIWGGNYYLRRDRARSRKLRF